MRTVSCSSCDAQFPAAAIPSPATARCPRCEEPLTGPRKQRFAFASPPLTQVDLFNATTCAACGCVLSLVERAGVPPSYCRYPVCQHKRAAASAMALQQKTLDEHAQKQADELDAVETLLAEIGQDPAAHDIAILPAFDRPLKAVSDFRRHSLAEWLADIRAELAQNPSETPSVSYTLHSKPTDPDFMAQACATCRGDCCQNGGNRAYLTPKTIARAVERSNGKTLDEVVDDYLDAVPEQSYEESCIFHSAVGCNLPGPMRSDTCNDFFCSGVRSLSTIVRGRENPPVLAAALKGEKVVRLVVINGKEMLPLWPK